MSRCLVSVIVPMRDEAVDIAACLARVASQTYGCDNIELVLADADSIDDTIAVATNAAHRLGLANVIVVNNPRRRTSIGLNAGLAVAHGDIVVRVDARSRLQPEYIARCVATLEAHSDVGVVGGAQIATPRGSGWHARSIARALNNRWLMGFARYRRGGPSGPTDTVWMGAFRAADLRRLGGWDDDTALNEDYELNERYRAKGFVVWFDEGLRTGYLPRQQIRLVARQYVSFGRVKADGWVHGRRPAPRQIVLLAAPPVALLGAVTAGALFGPLPVVGAAIGGLLVIDALGASDDATSLGDAASAGPERDGAARKRRVGLFERIGAVFVNLTIAASWWWGVVSGWRASRRGSRPQAALATHHTRESLASKR